jgi:FtsP/CotA-like multicopper oxidase with cupredoxin domain
MPRSIPAFAVSLCAATAVLAPMPAAPALRSFVAPAPIVSNDNRRPAGKIAGGVLTVRLETRMGLWEPDGPGKVRHEVAAFAEPDRPLQVPGPLLRAPAGTEIRASVHNTLTKTLWIYGMGATRGFVSDSFDIAPGATREIRFRVTEPGLYYYAGRTSSDPVFARGTEDSQLNGAIVVDPAGTATPPADRIFVISDWFTLDSTSVSGLGPDPVLAFNGLSWPHTEPLTARQGDSLSWRFINVTPLEHPLHLHGFYFRVDAKGDGTRDTTYSTGDRRLGVTETVMPGQTVSMTWAPTRSGNWILHCHLASHIVGVAALEADRRMPSDPAGWHGKLHAASHSDATEAGNPMKHNMAGLVLGIRVTPSGRPVASTGVERPLRLVVRSRPAVYGQYAGYSYLLGGSPEEADPDAMPIPGPTLTLEKGKPVAVTIVNRTHEDAAVHWHGIELESFPDGVAGWSGEGKTVLPMIEPGDSLTVRFTPPRAGTFMYHSHSNEFQQIGSGLYGALVVTEPGAARDPVTDRVLLFSDAGPTINFFSPPPAALINGRPITDTLVLKAGVPQRLRLINIRTDYVMTLELLDGESPVQWRVLAKDGADLPAAHSVARPAVVMMAPGEIMDVEVTPAAGMLGLKLGLPTFSKEKPVTVPVAVR